MSDQDPKGLESLQNKDCSCDLPLAMLTSAAAVLIEQLLTLFVYLHAEYLESLSLPSEDQKSFPDLKVILTETKGKIFRENFNFVESKDISNDTKMLENVIEAISSKCKDVLRKEEGTEAEKTDEMFYEKLYCLLNCTMADSSLRNKEKKQARVCRNVPTPRSNTFGKGICSLEQRVNELEATLENERVEFKARIVALEKTLTKTEEALNEIATEYCDLMADIEKKKKEALFRELMQLNRGNTSTTESPQSTPRSEETSNDTPPDSVDRMSKEESSSTAEQRLTNKPTNAIELELYNNYKLLLLQISEMLLDNDKEELQNWVANTYSVEISGNAYLTLVELDKRGIISSSNLSVLRDFFEHIIRFDMVYIIDSFLAGDYTYLRSLISGTKEKKTKRANLATSATRQRPINPTVHHQDQSTVESSIPRFAVGEAAMVNRPFRNNTGNERTLRLTTGAGTRQTVPDGARYGTDNTDVGSNGNKLSKPQREQQPQQFRSNRQGDANVANNATTGPWLCDHYKRRCLVKFECCERYWPCHRCHNSKSNCRQKKLKSRDIKMIKCVPCQKEQPFNETSQFCCSCGIKFAEYFCARCKHLTGTDDNPYHCEKCGICRIHGDRSFHCDVCGVCLDVQLKDNHKCREGSAHDECCICLEDAFTGCQILPCSHKVHKECATQMIRSGITRCPICRESFAHKLERRPLTRRKK